MTTSYWGVDHGNTISKTYLGDEEDFDTDEEDYEDEDELGADVPVLELPNGMIARPTGRRRPRPGLTTTTPDFERETSPAGGPSF